MRTTVEPLSLDTWHVTGTRAARVATDLEVRHPYGASASVALERCVVYAAALGDLDSLDAAERAGFRYVVDVDLPDGSLSLAVAEPVWVTAVDMDLDHVPQT